ncbi:MAG: hypothetical protein LUE10_05445 [Alistipes sp.]|nr:hypothetical protein [Alistipes sp.]
MKGRTITGLVLLGAMVTAGAFAQNPENSTSYRSNGQQSGRYGTTGYNENYNRNNTRSYGQSGTYDDRGRTSRTSERNRNGSSESYNSRYGNSNNYNGNRYGNSDNYNNRYGDGGTYNDNHYQPQRSNSSRYSDRNDYNNRSYDDGRYYPDRDNDQYIEDTYENGRNTSGRGTYDRYDQGRYYDDPRGRQSGYGNNYYDNNYYDDRYNDSRYRTTRTGSRSNERGIFRNKRSDDTRYNYQGYGTSYGSGYYNDNYERRYRDTRSNNKKNERGIFRSRRDRYENTRYDYPGYGDTRQGNYRQGLTRSTDNVYDGYRTYRDRDYDMDRRYNGRTGRNYPTGYSDPMQMPEGMMDYDTWMRYRGGNTGYDNMRRPSSYGTEYQRPQLRRTSGQW